MDQSPIPLPSAGPARAEPRPAISVVVPAYNEQEVLPAFHARLVPVMEAIGMRGRWSCE